MSQAGSESGGAGLDAWLCEQPADVHMVGARGGEGGVAEASPLDAEATPPGAEASPLEAEASPPEAGISAACADQTATSTDQMRSRGIRTGVAMHGDAESDPAHVDPAAHPPPQSPALVVLSQTSSCGTTVASSSGGSTAAGSHLEP